MSKPTLRGWHMRFKEGDGLTPVTDQLRSRHPTMQTTPAKVQAARQAVEEDWRATLKTITNKVEVSVTTAHRLLKKKFELKHKVAKFIPCILTDEQKRMRVFICTGNLQRLRTDPNLLDKVLCGDDSPVYLLDLETRKESKQWLSKETPHPTKALRGRVCRKMMLTAFFDARGMVLMEYNDGIVDTDTYMYIEPLRRLREHIHRKRPFMWRGINGVTDREFIIQHDNASCHTSNHAIAFLFDQDLLAHPPYSLDIVPCNFFLFPHLKKQLRGHRHQSLRDLKTAVTRVLRAVTEDQCQALVKLPLCWCKCTQADGEYFKGCNLHVPFNAYFDLRPDHNQNDEDSDIE